MNFLHENVTRKDINAKLKIMTQNLAARVANLKYIIRNVLQVFWPQLLKMRLDKLLNIEKMFYAAFTC